MIKATLALQSPEFIDSNSLSVYFRWECSHNVRGRQATFEGYLLFKTGYPNDEIYMHEAEGDFIKNKLQTHVVYEIENNESLQSVITRNAIHPRNRKGMFQDLKHYVIYFQDEVLECIAEKVQLICAE